MTMDMTEDNGYELYDIYLFMYDIQGQNLGEIFENYSPGLRFWYRISDWLFVQF